MIRLREKYDLRPLVIHTNYLVNLASTTPLFLKKSIEAFRGEVERALALRAELSGACIRDRFAAPIAKPGLLRIAAAIAAATQGLDLAAGGLTILIENTAGAEFSLGGSFEQVAEVLDRLRRHRSQLAPASTLATRTSPDTTSSATKGMQDTLRYLDATVGLKNVRVWHCNDAKAARGSKLDRHEHIGKGQSGWNTFRRLLNDPRLAHAAFIAETPIDEPGDDRRNVEALKKLVAARTGGPCARR